MGKLKLSLAEVAHRFGWLVSEILLPSVLIVALFVTCMITAYNNGRSDGYDQGYDEGWSFGAFQEESAIADELGCSNDHCLWYRLERARELLGVERRP